MGSYDQFPRLVVESKKSTEREDYIVNLITEFGNYDGLVAKIKDRVNEFLAAGKEINYNDDAFVHFIFEKCPTDISNKERTILVGFIKDALSEKPIALEETDRSDRAETDRVNRTALLTKAIRRGAWGHEQSFGGKDD